MWYYNFVSGDVYSYNPETETSFVLPPVPGTSSNGTIAVSPDSNEVYIGRNHDAEREYKLYKYTPETGLNVLLDYSEGLIYAAEVTADGSV